MAEIVAMEGTWQEKRLHYGFNEQIFGADKQDPDHWRRYNERFGPAPVSLK